MDLCRPAHHEAGLGPDAVGDGLDPAVGQHHAVLPRDLRPVALLLLVEVVTDVVLDRVPKYGLLDISIYLMSYQRNFDSI